jgi:predicted cupin superfamily sugar epimerase
MGHTFYTSYQKQNDNSHFNNIIKIFKNTFASYYRLCPNHGQHLKGFLVGHNRKGNHRGCATKKLVGSGQFERTIVVVANCQLIGCLNNPTFAMKIIECGKDK